MKRFHMAALALPASLLPSPSLRRKPATVIGRLLRSELDGIAVRLLNVSHGGIKVSIEDADADVTQWVAGHTATLRQS